MSGIEIAGLVLGGFPLLISALERYQEGAEILDIWWNFKRAYKKCMRDLKYYKLDFEQILEQCLLPLIVDDEELKTLISNPGGDGWGNPDLEERLKGRLPKSYDLYLEYIKEINEVIEKLKEELGVDKDHSSLEYQMLRLKFSVSKTRNKRFEELKEYNNKLRNLLKMSDKTEALRQSYENVKKPAKYAVLGQFWYHAYRLYNLVAKAWSCGCQEAHCANLLLRHRETCEIDFRILFIFAHDATAPSTGHWTWQETNIKRVENIMTSKSMKVIVPPPPLQDPRFKSETTKISINSPGRPALKRPRPPGIQHASSSAASISSRATASVASTFYLGSRVSWHTPVTESQGPQGIQENISQIKSLCAVLDDQQTRPSCFGFLQEDDNEDCYYIYPGVKRQNFNCRDSITLQDLLSRTSKQVLTRAQRYSIALTLASSHLQLYSSPWLCTQWSKKEIVFLHEGEGDSKKALINQPYIHCHFPRPSASPSPSSDCNSSFVSLGIMLLELCYGIPLEEHSLRQKFLLNNGQYLDHAAALEWSNSVVEEGGPEYAEAVAWCLQPKWADREVLRKDLTRNVIERLEYCHRQLSSALGT